MNAETCKERHDLSICVSSAHSAANCVRLSPTERLERTSFALRMRRSVPTRAEHLERLLDRAVSTGLEIAGRKAGDLDRRRHARAVVALPVRHESLVR